MQRDPAVSAVIGEVLMISLVLILVPMVTVFLLNQMPEDRIPSVSIKMGSVSSSGEVYLYHKGGDWIRKEQIHVIVDGIEKSTWEIPNQTFDLGDILSLKDVTSGNRINLVVHNAVVFSGVAGS
ncbi:MAG TPA: type IV pilin N-terminal domain-containing protein [Methanospirillum sp.]|uniref:type IV pilin N-terminal domain-containing protein n=1 Tax=Methanospirillum sp. TaxID=45200 RepID=UPI002CEC25E2|nr:type IV pilin N-terminal domain-containing protein [Methanospirillum sp.]HWQ64070.1 type IV pilin N-terminal domain-containing protein [Methanospirillum sp.]